MFVSKIYSTYNKGELKRVYKYSEHWIHMLGRIIVRVSFDPVGFKLHVSSIRTIKHVQVAREIHFRFAEH